MSWGLEDLHNKVVMFPPTLWFFYLQELKDLKPILL